MSDETPELQTQEAPVAETSYDAPSQDTAGSETSTPGFDTPYSAFRHLPDFQGQDDLSIAQNLYRAYNGYGETQRQLQQYQSVVPYAQEYLRNQREFETWKKSQAEAAKPKEPEAPKWWSPPQVKDTWKSYIVRDPATGKEVISQDAPYEAQQALREYQSYTADFARKLVTDPENTLKPFVEQVAIQKAQEMVQNHLSQYQTQNYVQDLERQNADWLYDQQGNPTREGQAISQYIAQAQQLGIQSANDRWKYATGMLQRDLLNMRYQQMQQMQAQPQMAPPAPPVPQADPVAEQNMQFLRERATRTPNRSAGTTEPRAPRARMSFEDRLKSQLANDGVI
jgi:hypothetical protein